MNIRSLINKPVTKEEIAQATRVIVRTGSVSPIVLSTRLKLGYSKANRIIALLQGAGVVTAGSDDTPRQVIIKSEEQAVNAVLRRYNKGKRGK